VITAFVLVEAERTALATLGGKLNQIDGVAEVYSVTGAWDFVAIVRVERHQQLADALAKNVAALEGVSRSQTMVAFDSFTDLDLDKLFTDRS
jgi:DNA-binding Lrp family transcriptional regulator